MMNLDHPIDRIEPLSPLHRKEPGRCDTACGLLGTNGFPAE
ncbi:MAG: hypothetical protein PHU46_09145 [Rhodocyclaceae bacterium]|nr:hypothetical protein [Rhodocyclaceae bacterium]